MGIFPRRNNSKGREILKRIHETFTNNDIDVDTKNALLPQLEDALLIAVEHKSPYLKTWVFELCEFCVLEGQSDFFIRLCQSALKALPRDKELRAGAYTHWALTLKEEGRLDDALTVNGRSWATLAAIGDRIAIALSQANRAEILMMMGRLDEAETFNEAARAVLEEFGHEAGVANCHAIGDKILKKKGEL